MNNMKKGKIVFDRNVKKIGSRAFEGFSSLTSITIPKSVETIEDNAFSNCENLNNINYNGSIVDWYKIIKHPDATWYTDSSSGIPSGWNIEDGINYLTFTTQQSNSTIGLNKLSTYQTLEYSYDKSSWNSMNTSTTITLSNIDDKVYLRGILSADNTYSNYTQFKMTGKIAASGNINSIWNYRDLNASLKKYCGSRMFYNCTSLTTAPELPATILANDCYASMFNRCTSLTTAPELPATKLAEQCYSYMFYNCTSLTTAPEILPATTLAVSCYGCMFDGCTKLTTAPELPATKLVDGCYGGMFRDCTSLTTAPELPATTLAVSCYGCMFENCSNLNYIKCLATNRSVVNCTDRWVYNVSPIGTFVKHTNTTWSTGENGIPNGWEVVNAEI